MHDARHRRSRRRLDGQHGPPCALGDEALLQVRLHRLRHLAQGVLGLAAQLGHVAPGAGQARGGVIADAPAPIQRGVEALGHAGHRPGVDEVGHVGHERHGLGMLHHGLAHLARHLAGGAHALERGDLHRRAAAGIAHVVAHVVGPARPGHRELPQHPGLAGHLAQARDLMRVGRGLERTGQRRAALEGRHPSQALADGGQLQQFDRV